MLLLARRHLGAVVVAEEVQKPVDERPAPLRPYDLRAQHHVAERARDTLGDVVTTVERERQDVGRLVDAEVRRA